jgi:acetyl-CoA carboxylase biotin carboxyl carrier protein
VDNLAETDDAKTIRELLAIMHEHDLDTIKVKVGDAVYELVRRDQNAVPVPMAYAAAPAPTATAHAGGKAAPPADVKRITAPLTGVFYRSSSPDSDPFVSEGSRIEAGSVVCILEAMKLFNEIQSDFGGSVVRIFPENGELVSQGEDLFWIGP